MNSNNCHPVDCAPMNGDTCARNLLRSVQVPVLVIRSMGNRVSGLGKECHFAEKIPGYKLIDIDTNRQLTYLTLANVAVGVGKGCVTGWRSQPLAQGVVSTIMFTDIVGSTTLASQLGDQKWTALLRSHHAKVRRVLASYSGREQASTGDGLHATFDAPARAIRCACEIQNVVRKLRLRVRIGLHTGECVATSEGIEGLAVHIAARVAGLAGGGEIFVSQTVKDLVAGSSLDFVPRGERQLRGINDPWRLYAVKR